MKNWVNKARECIGDEQFEQLMSMRKRTFGYFGRREMLNNMGNIPDNTINSKNSKQNHYKRVIQTNLFVLPLLFMFYYCTSVTVSAPFSR